MDRVVQQNAASAEESAGASQQLNDQSQILRQTVKQLAFLVGGMTAKAKDRHGEKLQSEKGSIIERPQRNREKAVFTMIEKSGKKALKTPKPADPSRVIPFEEDF
jgi:methyl-accepting chemotaxis protein